MSLPISSSSAVYPPTHPHNDLRRRQQTRRRRISDTILFFTTLFLSFLMSTLFIFVARQNVMEEKEDYYGLVGRHHQKKRGVTSNGMLSATYHERQQQQKKQQQQQKQQNFGMEQQHQKIKEKKKSIGGGGGLSCEKFDVSDEDAAEMVYWMMEEDNNNEIMRHHDITIPRSEEEEEEEEETFLTVEWGGGWNNVRMSIETSVVLAVAMGRTLVLPPEQKIYLLEEETDSQKSQFSFRDFFDLDMILSKQYQKYNSLSIISMDEFLSRVGMKGKLKNRWNGVVEFPPDNNRTDWNVKEELRALWRYLSRTNGYNTNAWKPSESFFVFDSIPEKRSRRSTTEKRGNIAIEHNDDKNILNTLRSMMEEVENRQNTDFIKHPPAIDAPVIERFKEILPLKRKNIVSYDEIAKSAIHIHLSSHDNLFTHFYSYLFFTDWKDDIWIKRFVRDNLRYIDELQCIAAKIVRAIRDRSKKNKSSNKNSNNGYFDSFHVRRGDFAQKIIRVNATQLYENSKNELQKGTTIYIATDEKDLSFFETLKQHYDICFLDDFAHLYEGINPNYKGMLDQLVASKGRIFFGSWSSTFTSYIIRLRGYHNAKMIGSSHDDKSMASYFFAPTTKKYDMMTFSPVTSYWQREFPLAWRGINQKNTLRSM